MRALALAATIIALGFGSGTFADSTRGDQVSPSQFNTHAAAVTQVAALRTPSDGWAPYVDERNGFRVELPFGMFNSVEHTKRGIMLRAPRFGAVVDVYTSQDSKGFDPKEFVAAIERADRVREVTYRAGGKRWFVRSGFYSRTKSGDAVIFYTKFMFSADRTRLAAFEISFPAKQKPRFYDVVERVEDSFSGPSR